MMAQQELMVLKRHQPLDHPTNVDLAHPVHQAFPATRENLDQMATKESLASLGTRAKMVSLERMVRTVTKDLMVNLASREMPVQLEQMEQELQLVLRVPLAVQVRLDRKEPLVHPATVVQIQHQESLDRLDLLVRPANPEKMAVPEPPAPPDFKEKTVSTASVRFARPVSARAVVSRMAAEHASNANARCRLGVG